MSVTFRIKASEAQGRRLDPHFHSPIFRMNRSRIESHRHLAMKGLCELSDETWDKAQYFQDRFPYVEIGAINCENGEIGGVEELMTAEAPSRAQMVVRAGDLLVSATRPTRNAIAIVPFDVEKAIASTGFLVVRGVRSTLVAPKYLFHALRMEFCTKQFNQYSSGGNYPAITKDDFRKIIIPLPPLPEQQKIVAELDAAYAAKRAADEKATKLLASIDNMVLKELGIARLPKPDTSLSSRIFTVPAREALNGRLDSYSYSPFFADNLKRIRTNGSWRLGELVTLSHRQWDQKEWKGNASGDFPYIEIGAISVDDGEIGVFERVPIADAPSRAKMMVVAGDLLVSLTRPTRRAIAFATDEAIASTGFAVIHGFSDEVMPEYLSVILRSELCTYQFDQRSTGGNYPAITEEQLLRCEIPFATKEVQTCITSAASSIRAEARKLKADATAALDAAKRKVELKIIEK